ncbi:uncharacterized protein LOC122662856 [Telopea speciosissima]|uniref:uncharacterized protein LOC122662856 n=1 Tax=Telopea speciosissima TaxID=54955 RepID=UPI001CC6638C|nr:uncharacterized protein LOC122662856 [Telopea speciosissima]
MTHGADSSSSFAPSLAHSPYFLHASENPSAPLITPVLDGNNFPTWHHAMLMALEAKNKLQLLDGSLPKPDSTSTDLPHWIRCNSMVRSWLVHSIVPGSAHNKLWFDSTRDAWVDLHSRFSPKNAPQTFEIRSISTLKQGLDSISTYYTKLKSLCDELASYHTLPPRSCGSATKLHEFFYFDSLMDFLQGLNDSYSVVRSQILLMDQLPTIAKAYSLLLQDEQQRSLHSLPAS